MKTYILIFLLLPVGCGGRKSKPVEINENAGASSGGGAIDNGGAATSSGGTYSNSRNSQTNRQQNCDAQNCQKSEVSVTVEMQKQSIQGLVLPASNNIVNTYIFSAKSMDQYRELRLIVKGPSGSETQGDGANVLLSWQPAQAFAGSESKVVVTVRDMSYCSYLENNRLIDGSCDDFTRVIDGADKLFNYNIRLKDDDGYNPSNPGGAGGGGGSNNLFGTLLQILIGGSR